MVWATYDAGRRWQRNPFTGALNTTGADVDWASARRVWVLVTLEFSNGQKPPPGYPPPNARGYEHVLYRSTNGGLTWAIVPSKTVPAEAEAVVFTTPLTGWMTLSPGASVSPNTPLLAATTTAGRTWHVVPLPQPGLLVAHAAHPHRDYAPQVVGPPVFATPRIGAVLSTYTSWDDKGTPTGPTVYFTYPVIYFTTNGGTTWDWVVLPQETSRVPVPPDAPETLTWQSTKAGWVLNVRTSKGALLAQWLVRP
jgi:hypothetical protein